MKKQIGYIGLGKMGSAMVARLKERKWRVETYDISNKGTAKSIQELVGKLVKPRVVWMMVPAFAKASAGKPAYSPVDNAIEELLPHLAKGDVVIDGGNSFYEDSKKRERKLARYGVYFLDVGVSGGPSGARKGACLMIGGDKSAYQMLENLFYDLAVPRGFAYMGKSGAGHFVKMVHNGIEYGMMQAVAEGFSVMKKAPFQLDLKEVARVYNNGSVIQSRLIGWLESGFKKYGEELKQVSGSVQHTGEGEWTVKTARKLRVEAPVMTEAFKFRVRSQKKQSYAGKILTALRNQFGGHAIR